MPEQNIQLRQITEVLNEQRINAIGKECGFCSRQRTIKPFELVTSLITALGDKQIKTLSQLHQYFVSLTETKVSYKPFHNQLSKPEFVELMKWVVQVAMTHWQQQVLGATDALADFEGIVLQDGSSFAIHDALKAEYKGRFTTVSPAAVEIHVSWDLLCHYPQEVAITPDSEAEYHHLPSAESLKGKLLLADRGYFKLAYIQEVKEKGGHCLIRAKTTTNPLVVKGLNQKGKALKRFTGRKLKDIKKYIRRSKVVDMDVEGKFPYRIIASWPTGNSEPTMWATTLPRDKYSAEDIMKLYRLRWQIELLFKEWKSYCSLGKFNTRKATMVEGLIWASLLALMLKRRIASDVEKQCGKEISTFLVAKNTQGWLYQLMQEVIKSALNNLEKVWRRTCSFLSTYALRASPKRDEKTGRTQYGIYPNCS